MKARKVPAAISGERLGRVIDTVAGGSLKAFAGRLLLNDKPPRGGSRRLVIAYRQGRLPIPESVIARICLAFPELRADYLRGQSTFMTDDDERDARTRGQALTAAVTNTATGTMELGSIFSVAGTHVDVRESVEALERLTPGGHVARSPLHDVWHRVCEAERLPLGKQRIVRLQRLVNRIDELLPDSTRPIGARLETYRLGVLAAMLAAFHSPPPRTVTHAIATAGQPKKPNKHSARGRA